jgi:hypothetical protein
MNIKSTSLLLKEKAKEMQRQLPAFPAAACHLLSGCCRATCRSR